MSDDALRALQRRDAAGDVTARDPLRTALVRAGQPDPMQQVAAILQELAAKRARNTLPLWVREGLSLIARTPVPSPGSHPVISLQPMSGRSGRIHYLDLVADRARRAPPGPTQYHLTNIAAAMTPTPGIPGFSIMGHDVLFRATRELVGAMLANAGVPCCDAPSTTRCRGCGIGLCDAHVDVGGYCETCV